MNDRAGALIWSGSALLALVLHGALLFSYSLEKPGARSAGIGGIDIGLGPAGRTLGRLEGQGRDEVDAAASRGNEAGEMPVAGNRKVINRKVMEKPVVEPSEVKADKPQQAVKQDKALEIQSKNSEAPPKKAEAVRQVQEPVPSEGAFGSGQAGVNSAPRSARSGNGGGSLAVQGNERSGAGDATEGGGRSGGEYQTFYATLQQWIQRHQSYPPQARRLKQQGVVLVRLGITAEGRLLFVRVQKSSGYPLLDAAALDAVRQSDPLPPVPEEMGQQIITLDLPMQYVLT